jgi:hypothetical protein
MTIEKINLSYDQEALLARIENDRENHGTGIRSRTKTPGEGAILYSVPYPTTASSDHKHLMI